MSADKLGPCTRALVDADREDLGLLLHIMQQLRTRERPGYRKRFVEAVKDPIEAAVTRRGDILTISRDLDPSFYPPDIVRGEFLHPELQRAGPNRYDLSKLICKSHAHKATGLAVYNDCVGDGSIQNALGIVDGIALERTVLHRDGFLDGDRNWARFILLGATMREREVLWAPYLAPTRAGGYKFSVMDLTHPWRWEWKTLEFPK